MIGVWLKRYERGTGTTRTYLDETRNARSSRKWRRGSILIGAVRRLFSTTCISFFTFVRQAFSCVFLRDFFFRGCVFVQFAWKIPCESCACASLLRHLITLLPTYTPPFQMSTKSTLTLAKALSKEETWTKVHLFIFYFFILANSNKMCRMKP